MEASKTASLQADADPLDAAQKEERHLRPFGQQPALLTPVPSRPSQDRLSLHHTRSHASHVDGHGYFSDRRHEDQDGEQQVPIEGSAEKAFEVGWDGPDDPMNPKNMSTVRKWMIVMINAFGAFVSKPQTLATEMLMIITDQMNTEFGNSRIVATLGLTLFVFGLGLSPMILGPLSEFYGRRPIYIYAYIFFTIWLIPCALAKNIQTMLIVRFLDGFSGSAFLSVAGGTVGDMFNREQLQGPMMIYTASPMIGPGLGPIIGGFINYNTSWRWSYYVLLMWAGVMLVIITIFVPETYMPVLLRKKARMKRKETGDDRWKAPIEMYEKSLFWTVVKSLYRPFLLLFMEPMCSNLCLLSSILLGILYLFFGAFNLVFSKVYGFNTWQVGLSFLGLVVGMLLAIASDPIWQWNYLRLVRNTETRTGERKSEPEFRLPPSIFGPWICTIGLFWFAWSCYSHIHWIVPIIATGVFGFGTVLSFTGVFTFLVEAYPLYAASALSANSFARSSFAGAFPLFGIQMYNSLNFHWASTLLGFLCLSLAPFPYLFFIYGKRLRQKSRFTNLSAS
nr:hypothetical protein LTR18_005899 [Exophiala xenobiotica]